MEVNHNKTPFLPYQHKSPKLSCFSTKRFSFLRIQWDRGCSWPLGKTGDQYQHKGCGHPASLPPTDGELSYLNQSEWDFAADCLSVPFILISYFKVPGRMWPLTEISLYSCMLWSACGWWITAAPYLHWSYQMNFWKRKRRWMLLT